MAKHWIVRIGFRDPVLRSGEGATATAAAIDAYGMVHYSVFCKPITLAALRSDAKRKAAFDDPRGWTGFERTSHKLRYDQEVNIDFLDKVILNLAAWEDGYVCSTCEPRSISYLPGFMKVKCAGCGEVHDIVGIRG